MALLGSQPFPGPPHRPAGETCTESPCHLGEALANERVCSAPALGPEAAVQAPAEWGLSASGPRTLTQPMERPRPTGPLRVSRTPPSLCVNTGVWGCLLCGHLPSLTDTRVLGLLDGTISAVCCCLTVTANAAAAGAGLVPVTGQVPRSDKQAPGVTFLPAGSGGAGRGRRRRVCLLLHPVSPSLILHHVSGHPSGCHSLWLSVALEPNRALPSLSSAPHGGRWAVPLLCGNHPTVSSVKRAPPADTLGWAQLHGLLLDVAQASRERPCPGNGSSGLVPGLAQGLGVTDAGLGPARCQGTGSGRAPGADTRLPSPGGAPVLGGPHAGLLEERDSLPTGLWLCVSTRRPCGHHAEARRPAPPASLRPRLPGESVCTTPLAGMATAEGRAPAGRLGALDDGTGEPTATAVKHAGRTACHRDEVPVEGLVWVLSSVGGWGSRGVGGSAAGCSEPHWALRACREVTGVCMGLGACGHLSRHQGIASLSSWLTCSEMRHYPSRGLTYQSP